MVNLGMAPIINYKASIGELMKEYLIPDNIPSLGLNMPLMATMEDHLIRVKNLWKDRYALRGQRVNHQIIDARKKAKHLFKIIL